MDHNFADRPPKAPTRRLKLSEALRRANISRASYYRDPSRLPEPVRERGRIYFFEHEIEEHFAAQAASRPGKREKQAGAGQ
ncbi:MAG: hypothetical protein AAFV45_15315 [Pseudomonadota bacterium]